MGRGTHSVGPEEPMAPSEQQWAGTGDTGSEPEPQIDERDVHDSVARSLATSGVPIDGYSTDRPMSAGTERRERKPSRRKRWIGLAAVLAVVLLVVGLGYWSAQPSPLEAAYEQCDYEEELGVRLADGGTTLLLQTTGDENPIGIDFLDLICVYGALDMPTRITNQISSTRALDGRVSDTWDNLTATWSYHPNSGLDLMITTE